jgi:hypothetical protein
MAYTTAFRATSADNLRSVDNEWQSILATPVVAPSIYPNVADKNDVTLSSVNSTTEPTNA